MTLQEFITKYNIKNVFIYGAMEERIMEEMASENGYTRKTTFTNDLSIAEWCDGAKGVKDTFNRVVKSWISNVEYFTEFVMCLNYKAWVWAKRGNDMYAQLYSELYYKAKDLGFDKYKGADAEYFWRTLD